LERQAANLLFALVARRYERGSIIVTSNRGFEVWGEILGDAMAAAALIDRPIHHAHIIDASRPAPTAGTVADSRLGLASRSSSA
jgi:DNA replication protein DnaC